MRRSHPFHLSGKNLKSVSLRHHPEFQKIQLRLIWAGSIRVLILLVIATIIMLLGADPRWFGILVGAYIGLEIASIYWKVRTLRQAPAWVIYEVGKLLSHQDTIVDELRKRLEEKRLEDEKRSKYPYKNRKD